MKPVALDILAILARIAEHMVIPPVQRLLLPPPDTTGKDAEFCALQLADGAIGLSYVLLGDTLTKLRGSQPEIPLAGTDALALAGWFGEEDEARRAVGLAAVNAISQCLFQRAGYTPDAATDSIGLLAPTSGDHIGMIGYFAPLIDRILASGAQLTVAELNPKWLQERDGLRVTTDLAELATCNKVVSTSTVLLNDTLDAVLAACRSADYFGIIGPTAGWVPDPLFARGVNTVGGMRIVDAEAFCAALTTGEAWGRYTEKYCLRAETYPGFDALRRRISP